MSAGGVKATIHIIRGFFLKNQLFLLTHSLYYLIKVSVDCSRSHIFSRFGVTAEVGNHFGWRIESKFLKVCA